MIQNLLQAITALLRFFTTQNKEKNSATMKAHERAKQIQNIKDDANEAISEHDAEAIRKGISK
ncbi:MAG: hypothetical protein JW739_05720 [Opitutales bacterium]|nr:hypothetical protein [Opitutales bacterium]